MQLKVRNLMQPNSYVVSTQSTLTEVVQTMKALDCWVISVGSKDGIEGIITDSEIVYAIAKGNDLEKATASDAMTADVFCCSVDDTVISAVRQMRENCISRIAVKDVQGNICGTLSFAQLLQKHHQIQDVEHVKVA